MYYLDTLWLFTFFKVNNNKYNNNKPNYKYIPIFDNNIERN